MYQSRQAPTASCRPRCARTFTSRTWCGSLIQSGQGYAPRTAFLSAAPGMGPASCTGVLSGGGRIGISCGRCSAGTTSTTTACYQQSSSIGSAATLGPLPLVARLVANGLYCRCDLTESDVDHMISRHTSQKGDILFVDFCSELLGLPDGFFSKDLIKVREGCAGWC